MLNRPLVYQVQPPQFGIKKNLIPLAFLALPLLGMTQANADDAFTQQTTIVDTTGIHEVFTSYKLGKEKPDSYFDRIIQFIDKVAGRTLDSKTKEKLADLGQYFKDVNSDSSGGEKEKTAQFHCSRAGKRRYPAPFN